MKRLKLNIRDNITNGVRYRIRNSLKNHITMDKVRPGILLDIGKIENDVELIVVTNIWNKTILTPLHWQNYINGKH